MAHRRSVEVVRESTSEETSFISASEYIEKNDAIYDQKLYDMLEGGYSMPGPESEYLLKILKKNLPKSINYILDNIDPLQKANILLAVKENEETISVLFHLSQEDTIVKIMKTFEPSQWKITSRNSCEENLLHYFISKGFKKAINQLLCFPEHCAQLLYEHDMLGNYPIMKTQSQDMEETAQLHMETNGRNSRKEAK